MVDETSIPSDETPGNQQKRQERRRKRDERLRGFMVLPDGVAVNDGRFFKVLADDIAPVSNFLAWVTRQTTVHDGLETFIELEISGKLASDRSLPAFTMRADDLPRLDQAIARHWGIWASISPSRADVGRVRAGIQHLSLRQGFTEESIHLFTGWHEIEGQHYFLHAGGGMGSRHNREEIRTRLPGNLSLVSLELLLGPEQTRAHCEAVLRTLDLAPARIVAPLLAAPFAAVLGSFVPVDFGLLLHGITGAGKTEALSIPQGFYGRELDSRHPLASAASTTNYLESLAFAAQHLVFGVDDVAPDGSRTDQQRKRAEIDRFLRSTGNQQGRGRMRSDGTLAASRYPRGLPILTGEAHDNGHSATGRMLAIEVRPGDIRLDVLTRLQADRADGAHVRNLTAFIRHIAGNWEEIETAYRSKRDGHLLHLRAAPAAHARHPATLATLFAAMDVWCDVMVRIKGITEDEARRVSRFMAEGLDLAAEEQREAIDRSDPVVQFLTTLRAAVSAGRAHLSAMDNEAPPRATALGWRREAVPGGYGVSVTGYRPLGERIGWIDERGVFLLPEASLAAVQAFGREQGISIPWQAKTLGKRLQEAGHIVSTETGRVTQKVTVAGARQRAWHIELRHIFEADSAEQQAFITEFPVREGVA